MPGHGRAVGNSRRKVEKRLRFRNTTVSHGLNTRLARTKAACNAVFHTQELLVSILNACDTESLLAMRATNHTIVRLIDGTPSLRQALFLEATPTNKIIQYTLDDRTKVVHRQVPVKLPVHPDANATYPIALNLGIPNPLVFTRSESEIQPLEKRFKLCETLRFAVRPNLNTLLTRTDSDYLRNLPRQMHVTQPPTCKIEVYFAFDRARPSRSGPRELGESSRFILKAPQGVRVGQLFQGLKMWICKEEDRKVPVEEFWLKLAKCAVWMKGTLFATNEEVETIEAGVAIGRVRKPRLWDVGPDDMPPAA